MSNRPVSKSSLYIDSLVNYTLDTKPYHCKLTEIAVEYQFEDFINVKIEDRLFSRTITKAGWLYDFFSSGNPNLRVLPLQRLVSPYVIRGEHNRDIPWPPKVGDQVWAWETGVDDQTDYINVPSVFYKKSTIGYEQAWRTRGAIRENMVKGLDFFHSYGSMQLRVSLPPHNATDQTRYWQSTNAEGVMEAVAAVTRSEALDTTNQSSSISRITAILDAIEVKIDPAGPSPNPAASAALEELYLILAVPDLPRSYEALLNSLVAGNTPLIVNPETGVLYTGWIGEDGLDPAGDPLAGTRYVDEHLSQLTPPAYFGSFTDNLANPGGLIAYPQFVRGRGYAIISAKAVDPTDLTMDDVWTITTTVADPLTLQVVGATHGDIGSVVVPASFTSPLLTFDTFSLLNDVPRADELAVVGDEVTLAPQAQPSLRESSYAYYDSRIEAEGYSVVNARAVNPSITDEWTLTTLQTNPFVVLVFGATHGFTGGFVVGSSFSSTFLTFDTELSAGTPAPGDQVTFDPINRLTIADTSPPQVWDLIKTDPLAYSRPVFASLRYGSIESLDVPPLAGRVSILSDSLAPGTIVLTAQNATTFTVVHTGDPALTGTATVDVPFTDSGNQVGFTILAGTDQAYEPGDRFYIQIVNEPARPEGLDLYYAYDLDSYDDQTVAYDASSPFQGPLGFRFDSRFIDYDLHTFDLQLGQLALNGRRFRVMAVPDLSRPIEVTPNAVPPDPTNAINLYGPAPVGTDPPADPPVTSMVGDDNPEPDLLTYYASNFQLEWTDDDGVTWNKPIGGTQGLIPVGGSFSSIALGVSFTIAEGSKPFIAVSSDDGLGAPRVEGGDVFAWTVINEPPRQDPVPASFSSPNVPYLLMHGENFWDAPDAKWTLTFTDTTTYTLSAVFTSGPPGNVGAPLLGHPISDINLTIPGPGVHRNLTYRDQYVHYTVKAGSLGFAAGDVFTFNTYARKPSVLVHGSGSGWQESVVVGEWYDNGHLAFRLSLPRAVIYVPDGDVLGNPAPSRSPHFDDGKITVTRVRPDTPALTYTFTRRYEANNYLVQRADLGVVGHVAFDGTFTDAYLTITLANPDGNFTVATVTDPIQFWNSPDLVVVHPDIDARAPEAGDFSTFCKAEDSRAGIRLNHDAVTIKPDIDRLSLGNVNPALVDIDTGPMGVPIERHSPEVILFDDWIPLLQEGYDAATSIAHFPDAATEVRLRSAATGEAVGRIFSLGTLNEPIYFEWDEAFYSTFLPLNTETNVITYGTFLDEKVAVRFSELLYLLVSGGALADDALFTEVINVLVDETHQWAITLGQQEEITALVQDSPFGGFLPGYSNLPYDAELIDAATFASMAAIIAQRNADVWDIDAQLLLDIGLLGFVGEQPWLLANQPTSADRETIYKKSILGVEDDVPLTTPQRAQFDAVDALVAAAETQKATIIADAEDAVELLAPSTGAGAVGQYDTGLALVDHFTQAQLLAAVVAPSQPQEEELDTLLALIGFYLQPSGITATTFEQFVAALVADTTGEGGALPIGFGRPALGAALDVNEYPKGATFTSNVSPAGGQLPAQPVDPLLQFKVGARWLLGSIEHEWNGATWVALGSPQHNATWFDRSVTWSDEDSVIRHGVLKKWDSQAVPPGWVQHRHNELDIIPTEDDLEPLASALVQEAVSIQLADAADTYDISGYDTAPLDFYGGRIALMFALKKPAADPALTSSWVPVGTDGGTYDATITPLEVDGNPVRTFQISFLGLPNDPVFQAAFNPVFKVYYPGDTTARSVGVVSKSAYNTYVFTTAVPTKAKILAS